MYNKDLNTFKTNSDSKTTLSYDGVNNASLLMVLNKDGIITKLKGKYYLLAGLKKSAIYGRKLNNFFENKEGYLLNKAVSKVNTYKTKNFVCLKVSQNVKQCKKKNKEAIPDYVALYLEPFWGKVKVSCYDATHWIKFVNYQDRVTNQDIVTNNGKSQSFIKPVATNGVAKNINSHKTLINKTGKIDEYGSKSFEDIADLSHEIRTPLTAIIGFSQLISKSVYGNKLNDKYIEYANLIEKSGQYILDLLSGALDLSASELGNYKLNQVRTNLKDIINDCISLVKIQVEKAGLTIEVETDDDDYIGMIDKKIIQQILLNLLTNAIKFTKDGGIKIKLVKQDNFFKISVTDTGVGMTESEIKKYQKRYMTGDNVSDGYKGHGLGIPLSKRLCDLHGGLLVYKSEPGKGTVVNVYLPISHLSVEKSKELFDVVQELSPSNKIGNKISLTATKDIGFEDGDIDVKLNQGNENNVKDEDVANNKSVNKSVIDKNLSQVKKLVIDGQDTSQDIKVIDKSDNKTDDNKQNKNRKEDYIKDKKLVKNNTTSRGVTSGDTTSGDVALRDAAAPEYINLYRQKEKDLTIEDGSQQGLEKNKISKSKKKRNKKNKNPFVKRLQEKNKLKKEELSVKNLENKIHDEFSNSSVKGNDFVNKSEQDKEKTALINDSALEKDKNKENNSVNKNIDFTPVIVNEDKKIEEKVKINKSKKVIYPKSVFDRVRKL